MSLEIRRARKIILIRAVYFIGVGLLFILFLDSLSTNPIQYIGGIIFIIVHLFMGSVDLYVVRRITASGKSPEKIASEIILFYSSISCYFCLGIFGLFFFIFFFNLMLFIFIIIHLIITVILISMTTSSLSALDYVEGMRSGQEMIKCPNCGYRFMNIKARCPSCKEYWITDPEQIDTKNKDIIFQIGLNFYNKKEIQKALSTFKKITKLDKKHDAAWYNVACCSSLLGKPKKALEALKKAIHLEKGWKDKAKEDKDFDNIRDTIEFNEMV